MDRPGLDVQLQDMRSVNRWLFVPLLGLMGCGPEGLSASLLQAPLAVGTRTGMSVQRCLKRDLVGPGKAILPCVDADPLAEITLSGEVDKVVVTDGGLGDGEHWLEVEAEVAGHVSLKVAARDEQGQTFSTDVGFDVFTPKTLRFIPWDPAGDEPRISYLVGAQVSVPECEITDQRDLPYFSLDFATRTEGILSPSADGTSLAATSPGAGLYEPQSEVLRSAGAAFRVTVVDVADVRGLVLAHDLVSDSGVVTLPPQAVAQLPSARLPDGGVSLGHVDVTPLFALVDGGWAHPLPADFDSASIERPDGGTEAWPCFESVCTVGGVLGTATYRVAQWSATVTVGAP